MLSPSIISSNVSIIKIKSFFIFYFSFAFVSSTNTCQFGFTETFASMYNGVSQSSCNAFIIMLGQM